jgi:hypothetical protein
MFQVLIDIDNPQWKFQMWINVVYQLFAQNM